MQGFTVRDRTKSQALSCSVYAIPLSLAFTIAISRISCEQICTLVYALGVSWFIKLKIGDPQPSKQHTNNLFSYTLQLPVQSDEIWGLPRPRLRKPAFNSQLTSFIYVLFNPFGLIFARDCDLQMPTLSDPNRLHNFQKTASALHTRPPFKLLNLNTTKLKQL